MPICTVDKKVSGLFERSSASFAFLSPLLAWASSLAFRADTKAISAIEKSPFNKKSPSNMRISIKIFLLCF
jgi:hypothetical protein